MVTEEEIARAMSIVDGNHPDACSNDEEEQPMWELYLDDARAVLALLQPALAKAVEAERDRCAKVAEDISFGPPEGGTMSVEYRDGHSDGIDVAQAFIAAAIRTRAQESET
jgi:hypothetical protein